MRHRASMRVGSARLSLRPEQLRQPVQLRIPVAQLLQCRDGCNDIVAVRSRHTMSLADVVQLVVQRKLPGILRMATVHDVA